ncbi:sialidase family protein [Pontibacter pudoricolor]|uniref:sialidase family protein n=1 Tax=Pontibacter pudoricolor TaxID=2694930 RepID=UPI001EE3A338|nr:sialidase family protein [Pontibacter pudoricolor]
MKTPLHLVSFALLLFLGFACNSPAAEKNTQPLAKGRQPQLSVDAAGVTRIVYGLEENIYCTTSTDNGLSFTEPELVGTIPGLLLGMSMGPQIASSANYTLVTAIDKKGNIHSFSLDHATGKWEKAAGVNDVPQVAAEGLMSIASDENDTFYALWLDVRNNKQNKIALATATGPATSWSANRIIYESPDSTVCECCKPSIVVNGEEVNLMFRNWLNGSRDFYFTTSENGGKTFTAPQKLGNETWKVDGCPMDGGGLVLDENDRVHTAWQRNGNIYHARPGNAEVAVGKGRNCRISGGTNPAITWKDGDDLKLKFLRSEAIQTIGKGNYIETIELPDKRTLCVWENDKELFFKRI